MKNKMLATLLLICIVFVGFDCVAVGAQETDAYDYSKLCFWTFRTPRQIESPENAEQLEEIFSHITGYKVVPSRGMEVRIGMTTGEKKTVIFPYGDLMIAYLTELVADETVYHVSVSHSGLAVPADEDEPTDGAAESGDSAVYGVAVLGVAAAALAVLLLRKKKI